MQTRQVLLPLIVIAAVASIVFLLSQKIETNQSSGIIDQVFPAEIDDSFNGGALKTSPSSFEEMNSSPAMVEQWLESELANASEDVSDFVDFDAGELTNEAESIITSLIALDKQNNYSGPAVDLKTSDDSSLNDEIETLISEMTK